MPETVVVVGGGDVAMDACRVAKRLPGCKHVKVIYRRGPGEIAAREIELHHAVKEDVEFRSPHRVLVNNFRIAVSNRLARWAYELERTQ